MLSCVIIADDFTGACDTGLQFVRAGLRCVVAVDPAQAQARAGETDVLVVDTESRNSSRSDAERRIQAACAQVSGLASRLVYKKVDSALRGNLVTEIGATMRELDLDLCLMAPAFPEAGRVTVGGYHLVHGVPVERTEVGHDPGAPVRGSFLPHLLDSDPLLTIRTIGLEEIAKGPDHVGAMVEGMRGAGPTVIVLDAASPEDLRHVAAAAARMSPPPLLCGSAGLAAQVPEAFGFEAGAGKKTDMPRTAGPVLVVVGSAESATRNQVETLRAALRVPEWEIHVEATAFAWERPHLRNLVGEVSARMARGEDAVLSLVGLREGIAREDVAHAIRTIAQVARRILDQSQPAGVVATGGWTAVEVLHALGGTGAEILEGVAQGVPLCRIEGGPFGGLPMVTKGGALGEREALVQAVERLRASEKTVDAGGRPLLGITMGDACGIGAEVIVKALSHPEVYRLCRPLVIGHPEILDANLEFVGRPLEIQTVASPEAGTYQWGAIDTWSPTEVDLSQIETGMVCPEAGRAAVGWVVAAAELAMDERIDGVVTAPLNKEAMNRAGFLYAGHTELLAERTGGHDVRLMLASERLNVVHVTGHLALHDVGPQLTQDRVFKTISLVRQALEDMDRPDPRIVVCGLNPHAGEAGLFGDEDTEIILPAVERAAEAGWDVVGPLPPDTVFFKAYDGLFDGVVAIYHDQGHIPVKLVAFDEAVNVTLGLPIVRTAVDHGTAFDIAGQGIADEANMLQAIRLGAKLAGKRQSAARSLFHPRNEVHRDEIGPDV